MAVASDHWPQLMVDGSFLRISSSGLHTAVRCRLQHKPVRPARLAAVQTNLRFTLFPLFLVPARYGRVDERIALGNLGNCVTHLRSVRRDEKGSLPNGILGDSSSQGNERKGVVLPGGRSLCSALHQQ